MTAERPHNDHDRESAQEHRLRRAASVQGRSAEVDQRHDGDERRKEHQDTVVQVYVVGAQGRDGDAERGRPGGWCVASRRR
jgi:hypothetical protein